jgi:hypothetical protein
LNGWYTSNVTASWEIVDPESIILSTSGCDTRTLTADTTGMRLTCTAVSDGGETTVAKTFTIDKTDPVANATPSRNADSNGWYNHQLGVAFNGTDATSGLDSCSAPTSYGGPDNGNALVSGTCQDVAGNTATASLALQYDETAPQTSPSARPPDRNGWYNHTVSVNFQGADATSGVQSCSQATYSGPDDPSVALTGTCVDNAGNPSTSSVFSLSYDETAPQVTGSTPSRNPDSNGWYNHALSINFQGNDVTSGLDSCTRVDYGGPDGAAISVSGTCTDRAGNASGTSSAQFAYDGTAPALTPAPSRGADANGWYNQPLSVTFPGTDATSGIASCTALQTYSGPDGANASVSGSCSDRAGNSTARTFGLRYDATAPQLVPASSRPPDANGWYNQPLNVTFPGTDATSGIVSCTALQTYSGPDNANAGIPGSCTDRAGNSTSRTFGFRYDATSPALTPSPSRAADVNGWYNHALSVSFAGTDATSGIAACTPTQNYSTPDSATASVSGSCSDLAGNSTSRTFGFRYDAASPALTPSPSRAADVNGWYNHALSVSFPGTDATSGIAACTPTQNYSTPDSATASVSGSCSDLAGNSTSRTFGFSYDGTGPQVTGSTRSRTPDLNGWYNHALTVAFQGTDATSGIGACTRIDYGGPDGANASVSGTCTDRAGNQSGASSTQFAYDGTAPALTPTPSRAADANGWYNHALSVSFPGIDVTSGIASCTQPQSYSTPDSATASVSGSCSDRAGNSTARTFGFRYDGTGPALIPTPSRGADANGWYNQALNVTFPGTDATSGISSCTALQTYSGPDDANAGVPGTCSDVAGNSTSRTFSFRYDATGPALTPAPSRGADVNGWYNHELTVGFPGTDATSGIASCTPQQSYATPDSATASVSGSCSDRAGNSTARTFGFRYDGTAPALTASPSRGADVNGWYNHQLSVSFPGTDLTSGIDACTPQQSYSTPDSANASVTGSCSDRAGNSTTRAFGFRYDGTPPATSATPTPQPNSRGWFKSPFSVSYTATDSTSGPGPCTAAQGYPAPGTPNPDTASGSFSGTCNDQAGNSSTRQFTFKYDATPPNVTAAVPRRAADRARWYNHPVEVDAVGNDAMSGLDGPCTSVTYGGPDGNNVPISGQCVDVAGNTGFRWFSIDYDGTGPQVAATANRGPDANGWYNHTVEVDFTGSDAVSGLESCAPPENYTGPDSGLAVVGGICLDRAGNAGVASYALQYDATAPQVTAALPARVPDSNGWYNQPLDVSFQGTDATSAIETCTTARYGGPDAAATSVSGFCRDRAGNRSSDSSFALRYDSTAPSLTAVTAKAGDRKAVLTWTASPDTTFVEIRRAGTVVYRGHDESFTDGRLKNGTRYRYTLTGYDEAHNAAAASTAATPTAPLVSPPAGATVTAPPRLAWIRDPKATHYNVQVWRKGRIFSSWPKGTSIHLKRSWTYEGRRYRLTPGKYRWYVWPGYGKLTSKKFGPMLGSSTFVVRAR